MMFFFLFCHLFSHSSSKRFGFKILRTCKKHFYHADCTEYLAAGAWAKVVRVSINVESSLNVETESLNTGKLSTLNLGKLSTFKHTLDMVKEVKLSTVKEVQRRNFKRRGSTLKLKL